jgi:putative endonuclease
VAKALGLNRRDLYRPRHGAEGRPVTSARSRRGGLARQSGRRGEVLAALLLMLKGYRVLGFRLASPQGEIDLLAVKGAAFWPSSRSNAGPRGRSRWRPSCPNSAPACGARRRRSRPGEPALKGATIRLDLIALAPGRLPLHIPDAWKGR